MEEHGGTKLTGIRQIVRLKELVQKWQSTTLGSKGTKSPPKSISRASSQRISNVQHDEDDDSCHGTHEPPPDVPEGYLAVYVGPELRRFIIPTSYLSHHLFAVLLEKAEEEFGFEHNGGLTIPCEIETFKYLLKCMEKENQQKDDPDNDADKQDEPDVPPAES